MTPSRLFLLIFTAQTILVPILCTEYNNTQGNLSQSIPAYAIISGAKYLNSTRCRKELEELRDAVDQRHLWSLRVLDSSGNPESGFIYGNKFWLGNRAQCNNIADRTPLLISLKETINISRYRHYEDEYPPFDLNFFVAYIRHNSTLQYHVTIPIEDIITLGLCLPDSCTKHELTTIFTNVFKNRTLLFSDVYDTNLKLVELKDLKDDHKWLIGPWFIIFGFICLMTILLMIVGTLYDVFILGKNKKKHKKFHSCENNNMSIQLGTKQPEEDVEDQQINLISQSTFGRTIQAFSIYTNTKIIFNMQLQADSIPSIHGLRFLGMLWIVGLHTIFYMNDVADNIPIAWKKVDSLAAQVIANSTLSVDTYFLISGFLMSYLFLISKEAKEIRHPINYCTQFTRLIFSIIKRFMRLTPAYMVTMAAFQINTKWYSKTSLFYITERGDELCSKYWWRNLLYIQNFFSRESMCMSWGWYLANDMQFFVIGTILLMLSRLYFKVSAVTISLMMLVSMVLTGYIAYSAGLIPTMDEQYHLLHELYDPPWVRIGPYIVGMISGYIYVKLDKKLPIKRSTVVMLWIMGSACNLLVLFGLFERRISLIASAFYSALSRTAWGVGIAWVIIACCTNHGGVVNRILSLKAWIPFSRMSYCVYLLNPILITSVYLNGETAIRIDFLRTISSYLGNIVISYTCAYFFTLMFETPYVILTKHALSSFNRKK